MGELIQRGDTVIELEGPTKAEIEIDKEERHARAVELAQLRIAGAKYEQERAQAGRDYEDEKERVRIAAEIVRKWRDNEHSRDRGRKR